MIIFLVTGSEQYGTARSLVSVAAEARHRGMAVTVLARRQGEVVERLAPERLEVLPSCAIDSSSGEPSHRLIRSTLRSFIRDAGRLIELGRSISARLAIVQSATLLPHAGLLHRVSGTPTVWEMPNTVRGTYPLSLNKGVYGAVIAGGGVIPVANSRYTAGTLTAFGVRPRVSHLGPDPALFDPSVATVSRQDLGLGDVPTFGVFARLQPFKGQLALARALAVVAAEQRMPVQLLLVGGPMDSPYVEEIRAVAAQSPWLLVHFIGPVVNPAPFYGAVDVAVNLRIGAEPFGLAVVESMLMQRPVLVHRAGGPSETVLDGVTGWHLDATDHPVVVEGIRRVFRDRTRWESMGGAAREHAVSHFTPAKHLDRLLGMTEEREPPR